MHPGKKDTRYNQDTKHEIYFLANVLEYVTFLNNNQFYLNQNLNRNNVKYSNQASVVFFCQESIALSEPN